MSAQSIKAGDIYGELSIKDKSKKTLDEAKKRWKSFVDGVGRFAAGIGVASIVQSVLGEVTNLFGRMSEVGSRLDDLSQRTGLSIDALSALGYAAKLTGADLEDLEKGTVGLSKFTNALRKGSKEAKAALKTMGIDAGAFLNSDIEGQFAMLADGLAGIENPSQRAALAMQVLGKSGAKLIPMLQGGAEGLNKLFGEAAAAGAIVRPEDVKKTADLGDAWDRLGMVWDALAVNTGAALADTLIAIIEAITSVIGTVSQFIQNNQTLVAVLGMVFVAVGGIVAALMAVGPIVAGATMLWGALTAGFAAIFSPIGLAVAGIAAVVAVLGYLIYWALKSSGTLDALLYVFGGITNALMSGDWKLAGEIAMQSMYMAFVAGLGKLRGLWIKFKAWIKAATVGGVDPSATAMAVEEAMKPARAEAAKLAFLIAEAKAAREKSKPKAPNLQGQGRNGDDPGMPPGQGYAHSEFQRSAIAFLNQMGPESTAEKTLAASERTADATEAMEKRLEAMDGAEFE